MARFDQGYGMEQRPLTSIYLTEDSITVEFDFEGMLVELSGKREVEVARGTYLVNAGGGGVVDSGDWRLTWRPLEKSGRLKSGLSDHASGSDQ